LAVLLDDDIPPVTSVGPNVSGTTDIGTTLSVTISENGTGYYLVQAAEDAAPNVAAVLTGNSFAMMANSMVNQSITGLTAAKLYKIYFIARDATNHVQATVQSVAFTTIAAADNTPPVTRVGPNVSGTTDSGTTLSVTINENGTGYYLVQAAKDAAPNVAAVQAGSAFAMTANVAATPVISGLIASTAYKIYFVAKDAANNVQASVQNVAVTTLSVAAAPTASSVSIAGTAQVGQTLSGSYSYADANNDPQGTSTFRWLRNGTAIAGATASSYTLLAADQGKTIRFEVTPVSTVAPTTGTAVASSATAAVAAAPDVTQPITSSAPAIAVAATDTTASVTQTINENGTGYYLLLPAASAAPTVAVVKAGTAFAMSAATPAVVALTGLTASTAYKYYFVAKDAANNDQAAVSAGLAITTTADITPPAAPTGLALNNGAANTSDNFVTLDGLTTPPDADLAAWFVSESGSAPVAGAAGWSSGKPTTYFLGTVTNETKTVCVYVKDTSNNVQPTAACDTIDKVP
jgi:hypothetical protein